MIPPLIDASCTSPGERLLFDRFRDSPECSNWVVLHSLGVAKHRKRQMGEIDFVVLIPDEGILCLEIKAGSVRREHGTWIYGGGVHETRSPVGPFRQASDAMHSIRDHIVKKEPEFKRLLFWSGVIFTGIDFEEQSPEWHPWQYLNRSQLMREGLSLCCLSIIHSAHGFIRNVRSCRWYDKTHSRPTSKQIKRISDILRSDFEYPVLYKNILNDSDNLFLKYTTEQFGALDILFENSRVLFKGPAGTGKTFLAIEAARRNVLNQKRTLLVCFNKLLSIWISNRTQQIADNHSEYYVTGTFHQYLLELSGLKDVDNYDTAFWTENLPEKVIERIFDGKIQVPQFNALIIDEAQDLLNDNYLDVLDLLLEGGLAGGHWAMFGDFERQTIYLNPGRSESYDITGHLDERHLSYVKYPLRVNCRNSSRVAAAVEISCGLKPGYSRVLNESIGIDVKAVFYKTGEQQDNLLEKWIRKMKQGHDESSITILSTKKDSESCAKRLSTKSTKLYFKPIRHNSEKDSISYGSIHAFKGLESAAVILTDIEEIEDELSRSILYVGMTRARISLVILLHERCRDNWIKALEAGITREK